MRTPASIALRAWREEDLDFLVRLRNDVALQAMLLSTAKGSDRTAVRDWLARRTAHEGLVFLVVADPANDEPLGYVQADRLAEDAWRFGICLAPEHQGAGSGPAAIRALAARLSRTHGARTLTLEVGGDNARALSAYRRLGFRETGRHPRHVEVGGTLRDVVTMALPIAEVAR